MKPFIRSLVKQLVLRLCFFMFLPVSLLAQEVKPTLMILPSDSWCTQRYFMSSYDNQGLSVQTPDYQKAFREDSELPMVVSKIGELLTKMGYSLKDAEQETKAVYSRIAEDNITMSSSSASAIAESPLDMIKKRAKMDILIQIWWRINKEAGGKSVSFTLEAFDSYTSKRIATSTGTSKVSNESIPIILEKAVKSNIKDFDKQMMNYYREMQRNGREVILTVKRWESWDKTLEFEYDGEELTDIIRKWVRKNAINGSYNLTDATENFLQFEQIRIPLLDQEGEGLDARGFAVLLRKYLNKEYGITSKVMTRGLGEGILVLGEK